jgi:ABC-type dipeptide/oligopeptide/nickel transport system permease subunit
MRLTDFFQDHPMLVVAIAATSGLLGLGLMAVPFILDTKTSYDTEPGLALLVVALFMVAWPLAALFLADAVALFARIGGAAESP